MIDKFRIRIVGNYADIELEIDNVKQYLGLHSLEQLKDVLTRIEEIQNEVEETIIIMEGRNPL